MGQFERTLIIDEVQMFTMLKSCTAPIYSKILHAAVVELLFIKMLKQIPTFKIGQAILLI